MPRPKRCRRVSCCPSGQAFKPQGVPARGLPRVDLGLDELEAIRLADLEQMDQRGAAERMQVSQPTFSRILATGRRKLAEAVVEGKLLRIVRAENISETEE